MVTNATTDPPLQHSNKEDQKKKKKQQISRRYRFEIYLNLRNILSNDMETFDQSEFTMTNFINQR